MTALDSAINCPDCWWRYPRHEFIRTNDFTLYVQVDVLAITPYYQDPDDSAASLVLMRIPSLLTSNDNAKPRVTGDVQDLGVAQLWRFMPGHSGAVSKDTTNSWVWSEFQPWKYGGEAKNGSIVTAINYLLVGCNASISSRLKLFYSECSRCKFVIGRGCLKKIDFAKVPTKAQKASKRFCLESLIFISSGD